MSEKTNFVNSHRVGEVHDEVDVDGVLGEGGLEADSGNLRRIDFDLDNLRSYLHRRTLTQRIRSSKIYFKLKFKILLLEFGIIIVAKHCPRWFGQNVI